MTAGEIWARYVELREKEVITENERQELMGLYDYIMDKSY